LDLRSEQDCVEVNVCCVKPHHHIVDLVVMGRVDHILDLVLGHVDRIRGVGGGVSTSSDELVNLVLHDVHGTAHHSGEDEVTDFISQSVLESKLLNVHGVS